MIQLVRTDSTNPHFIALVKQLDMELAVADGDLHGFYNQFNSIHQLNHVVIAYIDDVPAGCGAFKPFTDATVEIKRMFTPTSFRKQGVAAVILSELESWASELNYTSCVLETGSRQTEALHFYPKCGFRIIPNYGPYTGVENSCCFGKELA